MNEQSGPSEQAPKLDTLLSIWASVLWSALVLVVPVNIGLTPLEFPFSMSLLVKGICATALVILIIIGYFALRHILVSKGAAKSELDAVSKGIGRSFVFTALIAFPTGFALLGATLISVKLLGFWDTFGNDLHVTMELAICMLWVAVPTYIGWRLKGKSVYEECIRQLGATSS